MNAKNTTAVLRHVARAAYFLPIALSAQFVHEVMPRNERTPVDDAIRAQGDYLTATRKTGSVLATGRVHAVQAPFRYWTDSFSRSPEGVYDFGEKMTVSTCSNEFGHLHWRIQSESPFSAIDDGSIRYYDHRTTNPDREWYAAYKNEKGVEIENAWLYWADWPVLWIPYWYYPLDTNYGWRFLPGYRKRNGAYLLSGYVYNIVNEGIPDAFQLGGSSYVDFRTKNGFALGQTIRWGLRDFGEGKIKAWRAWDEDYDRYERHWNDNKHNYSHWGSDVKRERYRVKFEHKADFTERDSFSAHADFLSDSHLLRDFFDDDRRQSAIVNSAWYDHRELSWAAGVAVEGPVNRFHSGTARLPEGWLNVEPQTFWDLPVVYESQTRAGFMNRDFARFASEDPAFRYGPYLGETGRGADYQAFRADTAHRVTLPFKVADTISVVPRAGYRCTYWSDSGDLDTGYLTASGDALTRHVAEIGATFSARGSAWLDDSWKHVTEPYLDYSFQRANLSDGNKRRAYAFDAYDRSVDWLDQFGFDGRGLPTSWHGIRPGWRNYFQKRNDKGLVRTVLDADLYLAVPFDDEKRFSPHEWGNPLRGRPRDDEFGNYARQDCVVPGARFRYLPSRNTSFSTRFEYDADDERVAYADVSFRHRLEDLSVLPGWMRPCTDSFAWYASYVGRDHRIWDYLASNHEYLGNGNAERWNWQLDNVLAVGFEHGVCDWFRWSTFIRHDCRRGEIEEVGVWFDFLQDCLGYRFQVEYEDGFRRIDNSKEESDVTVAVFIYLRALGPSSMLDLAKF